MKNCINCEQPYPGPSAIVPADGFVLNAHLCPACQEGPLSLKLIITRATPTSPWLLESSQPIRTTFNAPGGEA